MAMNDMKIRTDRPLKWPEGWERTPLNARKPQASWKKPFKDYVFALHRELYLIGATEALLTINDLNERQDPGAAIYFSRKRKDDFSWQTVLGLNTPVPTLDEIDQAYKRKAMLHHPDRGGDVEIFRSLTKYRDMARGWVTGTSVGEMESVIPCDLFNETRLNVYALTRALNAFRQLDRVGVPAILERSFRGFGLLTTQNEAVVGGAK